ncbi:uncharacterized protein [Narcine bancroftii]|uniref:uncharacterized protein isoform X4 n=1 Tax=Narcine bancroftii TaxID=1343680 RepID=UPI00383126F9
MQHGILIAEANLILQQVWGLVAHAVWRIPWNMKNPIKTYFSFFQCSGFLLTLEKCWWLKNFLNSETPPHPINEELSSKSLKWQQKLRKIEFKYRTKLHSPTLEETRPTCPDRTTESRLEFS